MKSVADIREEYKKSTLDEADVAASPFAQFGRWFDEALAAKLPVANAMTLATVDAQGQPRARTVLLKSFEDGYFTFYTNLESAKARQLHHNPRASLLFFWAELERQVRIEGRVLQVSDADADAYFATRPRASQLGAWASQQSEVIASRRVLDERLATLETRFTGQNVPRPPYWGGYGLTPVSFEFWQGRPSRLHDRIRYLPDGESWRRERLSP